MRQPAIQAALAAEALSITVANAATADLPECAPDAVVAGTICLDKYEASMWRVPNPATANASLIGKILRGSANRGDLDERSAGRPADGGGMELRVAQAFGRLLVEHRRGHRDGSSETTRGADTSVTGSVERGYCSSPWKESPRLFPRP
jgi:hypothetical protein